MTALAPYRVLDLTTSRGWLCGRILADLGADVVKVEPPGGDPGRRTGPFAGDVPGPERSLRWWFMNRGKRSVVVDLERDDGRETLLRLAAGADVLVESFDPGVTASLRIGPADLEAVNPALVYTSITAFGQDGPRAHHRGPDLVLAAAGGAMVMNGDLDREPLRISLSQQYELHGAAEAAAWTTFALYHAARTGAGQHVDVSCQLAAIRSLLGAPAYWPIEGRDLDRRAGRSGTGLPLVYECLDGHVTVQVAAQFGGRALIAWAAAHVEVPEWLAGFDWEGTDFIELTRSERGPDFWAAVRQVLEQFLRTKTKQELYDEALRTGYLIAPVNTIRDVREDAQLHARQFFSPVGGVVHAGAWAKLSATPMSVGAPAPAVGEHTEAVLSEIAGRRIKGSVRAPRTGARDVFAGLRVLDLSWVGVGPMTARYLADLGADVVRVESTKRIDVLRALPPYPERAPGLNHSQFFADLNASKRGLGIDLSTQKGRDLARRLAGWADVVLQSFTPGTLAGWNLAFEDLREINPSLVMLSTCMQGQTGPHRHYRGFGQLIASLSGFYEVNGYADRPPSPIGAYTDTVCQRFAAAALVAALDHRRRTGEGQHIDLSQFEAGLQFLGPELLDLEVNDRVATRDGNRSPDSCPHGAYPCAGEDRWVVIAVQSDEEWESLCRIAGLPVRPDLSSHEQRKEREDEVDKLVSAFTQSMDAFEVVARLQPDVAAAVVLRLSDLHADPQIRHRGYFELVDGHPHIGEAPYEGMQAILSKTPGFVRRPGPCLGQHSWEILEADLGLSPDDIADLIAEEIVEITGGEG